MTAEARNIAARLAASPWFPLDAGTLIRDGQPVAVRESQAHVEVEGNIVTITVTDPDDTKREYRATVELVAGDPRTEP